MSKLPCPRFALSLHARRPSPPGHELSIRTYVPDVVHFLAEHIGRQAAATLPPVALPFLTVAGTLLFSALASLLLSDRSATDCLAVGSGMGYYSLSSVLIAELRTPACGAQLAAELGTLALLANILRELAAFFCAPWIARRWGGYALVSVAGAGSMDSVLPVIGRHCGEAMLPVAIFHGVVLEGLIPVLVTFFCGI